MDTTDNLTIPIPLYGFKWRIPNVTENCVIQKNVMGKPTGK
jgi:hypothetical protein